MSYSEEFTPNPDISAEPTGPVVLGVTLTPEIIGGIIAFLGVAIAGYIGYIIWPSWENVSKLQSEVDTKKQQVSSQEGLKIKVKKAKAELAKSKEQKKYVAQLFATSESMETFLIDLQKAIKPQSKVIKLKTFVPVASSLISPTDVTNKIKRVSFNINFEGGSFDQTVTALRNIERLSVFVEMLNFRIDLGGSEPQKYLINLSNKTVTTTGTTNLRNSFTLQAIVPLSTEELTKLTAPVPKK